MRAKRCPVCKKGEPQYVYYSIPGATDDPDGIYVLFKRLECTVCGATVAHLVMTCEDAVRYWNCINLDTGKRFVLQRIGTEPVKDIEPEKEEKECEDLTV